MEARLARLENEAAMSLLDSEENLNVEEQRAQRKAEYEKFTATEKVVDPSPYSWEKLRHQARHGLNDSNRHLIPFVTYVPKRIDEETTKNKKTGDLASGLLGFISPSAEEERWGPDPYDVEKDEEYTGGANLGLSMRKANKVVRTPKKSRKKRVEDKTSAAIVVQAMVRAQQARKVARKLVCKAWSKKKDSAPGIYYYQNIQTGESRWVPPTMLRRLMPGVRW